MNAEANDVGTTFAEIESRGETCNLTIVGCVTIDRIPIDFEPIPLPSNVDTSIDEFAGLVSMSWMNDERANYSIVAAFGGFLGQVCTTRGTSKTFSMVDSTFNFGLQISNVSVGKTLQSELGTVKVFYSGQ